MKSSVTSTQSSTFYAYLITEIETVTLMKANFARMLKYMIFGNVSSFLSRSKVNEYKTKQKFHQVSTQSREGTITPSMIPVIDDSFDSGKKSSVSCYTANAHPIKSRESQSLSVANNKRFYYIAFD